MTRLQKFINESRYNLGFFVKSLTGIDLDPWQVEAGQAYTGTNEDDFEAQISVRSGHGVGKTLFLASVLAHFPMMQVGRKGAVTAPTSGQLHDALIPELKSLIGKMPEDVRACYDVKQDRVEITFAPADNFVSFKTSRQEQPDALAGVHAPNGVVLVADEASGVPDAVYEFASGSMSGKHCQMVLAGNPVRTSGLFWKSHTLLKDDWKTFHVSCLDSPRVTQKFIDLKRKEYGAESNAFKVRVLGEFPLGDDDTVIPVDLIDSAIERDIEIVYEDIVWGVDAARGGADRNAICKRAGRCVLEPVRLFSGFDTMELVGFVHHEWETTPSEMRPYEIMVDSIGIGGPAADRLRELGLPARDVNVSESKTLHDANYFRLRDQLWFQMKAWFAGLNVRIPKDSVLVTELAMPRYSYSSSNQLKVESKDAMKRRGIRSPDAADALMMTFAGTAGVARFGRRKRRGNNKRRIKGIV